MRTMTVQTLKVALLLVTAAAASAETPHLGRRSLLAFKTHPVDRRVSTSSGLHCQNKPTQPVIRPRCPNRPATPTTSSLELLNHPCIIPMPRHLTTSTSTTTRPLTFHHRIPKDFGQSPLSHLDNIEHTKEDIVVMGMSPSEVCCARLRTNDGLHAHSSPPVQAAVPPFARAVLQHPCMPNLNLPQVAVAGAAVIAKGIKLYSVMTLARHFMER